ncbi:CLIP domain-containing serine protease HP8-like [Arctopsyche grandis]|uniref:CLIP domain-containing serine protease HP8-like n=1 Tax=Arctopsyche grandis TaxID=121162 RepID=UPI00406D6A1D
MLLLVKVSILISVLSIIKKRDVSISVRIGNECQTPDKYPGECIELEKCDDLLEKLKKSSNFNANSLKPYHCGFNGLKPKVCCPVRLMDQSTASEMTTTISPTIINNDDFWLTLPADVSQHPKLYLLPTDCGYSDADRIYGGNKTGVYEYPWMALLLYRSC